MKKDDLCRMKEEYDRVYEELDCLSPAEWSFVIGDAGKDIEIEEEIYRRQNPCLPRDKKELEMLKLRYDRVFSEVNALDTAEFAFVTGERGIDLSRPAIGESSGKVHFSR